MTDKHPKRPRDLEGPLWRLRHNTAQMACATSPLGVPLHPKRSWLNAVEGFAKLTRRCLKRGVFRSLVDLQVAINRFLAETNSTPKPFVWTVDPKRVLAAFKRGKEALESIHKQSRKSAFKRSLRR
jgi:hypothetical protein